MNYILLILCVSIHWIISIITSFYIFYRKSSTYDSLYFLTVCIVAISWTLTGNECLISYWEKLCIEPGYIFNSKPTLPYITLIFGELSNIVTVILLSGTLYNLYGMMTLYKVPFIIKLTFLYFVLYPMIKFRIEQFTPIIKEYLEKKGQ